MLSRLSNAVVIGAVILVALFAFDRCRDSRVSEWEARAQSAETLNATLQERVNDLQAEADSLRSQAVEIVEVVVPRISETNDMIALLPPPVDEGDEARDGVIVRLVGERDSLLTANRLLIRSNDRLQDALDTMTEARDSLLAVVKDRPGPRPWYIPEITVGASAVLDDGRVKVKYPSLNIGWKVGL